MPKTLTEDDTDRIIDELESKSRNQGARGKPAEDDPEPNDGDGQDTADVRQSLADRMAEDMAATQDDAGDLEDAGTDADAAAAEEQSIRQRLSGMGLTGLDRYEDDVSAMTALAEDYRLMADRMAELEEFRTQHTAAQAAAAEKPAEKAKEPEKPAWWNLPEFNPAWRDKVEFDPETGAYRHKLGVGTPQIAEKVNDYVAALEGEKAKFWQNPFDYIKEFVRHSAREVAEETNATLAASTRQRDNAQRFVTENESWLIAHDEKGQPVVDPQSRKPVPSEEGIRFMDVVAALDKEGVPVHLQGPLAKSVIERDMLARRLQGSDGAGGAKAKGAAAAGVDAEAARAKANMEIQKNAARRGTGRGGTVRKPANDGAARAADKSQNSGLNLRQKLRAATEAAGFKGDDKGM